MGCRQSLPVSGEQRRIPTLRLPVDYEHHLQRVHSHGRINDLFDLIYVEATYSSHTGFAIGLPHAGEIRFQEFLQSCSEAGVPANFVERLAGVPHLIEHLIFEGGADDAEHGLNLRKACAMMNGTSNASTSDTAIRVWCQVPHQEAFSFFKRMMRALLRPAHTAKPNIDERLRSIVERELSAIYEEYAHGEASQMECKVNQALKKVSDNPYWKQSFSCGNQISIPKKRDEVIMLAKLFHHFIWNKFLEHILIVVVAPISFHKSHMLNFLHSLNRDGEVVYSSKHTSMMSTTQVFSSDFGPVHTDRRMGDAKQPASSTGKLNDSQGAASQLGATPGDPKSELSKFKDALDGADLSVKYANLPLYNDGSCGRMIVLEDKNGVATDELKLDYRFVLPNMGSDPEFLVSLSFLTDLLTLDAPGSLIRIMREHQLVYTLSASRTFGDLGLETFYDIEMVLPAPSSNSIIDTALRIGRSMFGFFKLISRELSAHSKFGELRTGNSLWEPFHRVRQAEYISAILHPSPGHLATSILNSLLMNNAYKTYFSKPRQQLYRVGKVESSAPVSEGLERMESLICDFPGSRQEKCPKDMIELILTRLLTIERCFLILCTSDIRLLLGCIDPVDLVNDPTFLPPPHDRLLGVAKGKIFEDHFMKFPYGIFKMPERIVSALASKPASATINANDISRAYHRDSRRRMSTVQLMLEKMVLSRPNRFLPDALQLRRVESIFQRDAKEPHLPDDEDWNLPVRRVGQDVLPENAELYLHRDEADYLPTTYADVRLYLDFSKFHLGTPTEHLVFSSLIVLLIIGLASSVLEDIRDDASRSGLRFVLTSLTPPIKTPKSLGINISLEGLSDKSRDLFKHIFSSFVSLRLQSAQALLVELQRLKHLLRDRIDSLTKNMEEQMRAATALLFLPVVITSEEQLHLLESVNVDSLFHSTLKGGRLSQLFDRCRIRAILGGNVSLEEAVNKWMIDCVVRPLEKQGVDLRHLPEVDTCVGLQGLFLCLPQWTEEVWRRVHTEAADNADGDVRLLHCTCHDGRLHDGGKAAILHVWCCLDSVEQLNVRVLIQLPCELDIKEEAFRIILTDVLEQEFFHYAREAKNLAYYLSVEKNQISKNSEYLEFHLTCSPTGDIETILSCIAKLLNHPRDGSVIENCDEEVEACLLPIWHSEEHFDQLIDSYRQRWSKNLIYDAPSRQNRLVKRLLSLDITSKLDAKVEALNSLTMSEFNSLTKNHLREQPWIVQVAAPFSVVRKLGIPSPDFTYTSRGSEAVESADALTAFVKRIDQRREWYQIFNPRVFHKLSDTSKLFAPSI